MPVFFTYSYKRRNINFFVLKHDGKVLSFLDACARCYPERLGYRFEGGRFICRECKMGYSVEDIEKGAGSCHPIRLKGELRDGVYRIPLSEIEKHADKF